MCIKSFKWREIGSNEWSTASLVSPNVYEYIDTSAASGVSKTNYGFTRIGSTDSWSAFGGSASIWQANLKSATSENQARYLIEGSVANQSKTKFSLSLVPIAIGENLDNTLSSTRKSKFSRKAFPINTEYQIVVSVGYREQPLLWMTSRTNLGFVTKTFGPAQYTFEGQPQSHGVLTKKISECAQDFIQPDLRSNCEKGVEDQIKIQPSDEEVLRYLNDQALTDFVESERLEEWAFQNGDTANNANRYSMFIGDTEWPCQTPLAVMSTNASVFSFVAPEWNPKERQLKFKVANSHWDLNGKLSRGVFSYSLDYWTASCMWGLSGNTNVAEIQILSDDGTSQNIFTSVVRMDSELNKAQILISGFEFSAPKISIKLIDNAQVSAAQKPSSKSMITCVKGKLTKRVTGSPAKCPTGYKKKQNSLNQC